MFEPYYYTATSVKCFICDIATVLKTGPATMSYVYESDIELERSCVAKPLCKARDAKASYELKNPCLSTGVFQQSCPSIVVFHQHILGGWCCVDGVGQAL